MADKLSLMLSVYEFYVNWQFIISCKALQKSGIYNYAILKLG